METIRKTTTRLITVAEQHRCDTCGEPATNSYGNSLSEKVSYGCKAHPVALPEGVF
jgi:hypothetical protein